MHQGSDRARRLSMAPDRHPARGIATSSLLLPVLACLVACSSRGASPADGSSPGSPAADRPGSQAETTLAAALHASAAAWNRGDLDGFLAPYADDVVYIGSGGPVRGLNSVRERFRRVYFEAGPPSERLAFESRSVRLIAPDHALQMGRWVLTEPDGSVQSGWFTLLWERRPEGWRIVHDHSS